MRGNGVILQHGAEFIANLLVDHGDDLWMGNHVRPSPASKAIAKPFLTSCRSDRSRPFKPIDVRGARAKKVEKVQTFTLTRFSDNTRQSHTFGNAIRANT